MAAQSGELSPARIAPSPELAARRAVRAACFGFFVDMFDVYLPVAVLAPALVYFIPAGLSGKAQATIFYVLFAVTLIGRPLGAVIFGHFGDRLGRRRTTLVSVAGFTVVTLLIALLPGYKAWGGLAIAALVVLRLVNGVFIGGEYTAANPLAMEYAPKNKRGFYGALIHVGYPAALLCASALTAIMLAVAPGGDAASPYATWGWRIPSLSAQCSPARCFFIITGSFRNPTFGDQLRRARHL
jgi:MFS family permease